MDYEKSIDKASFIKEEINLRFTSFCLPDPAVFVKDVKTVGKSMFHIVIKLDDFEIVKWKDAHRVYYIDEAKKRMISLDCLNAETSLVELDELYKKYYKQTFPDSEEIVYDPKEKLQLEIDAAKKGIKYFTDLLDIKMMEYSFPKEIEKMKEGEFVEIYSAPLSTSLALKDEDEEALASFTI